MSVALPETRQAIVYSRCNLAEQRGTVVSECRSGSGQTHPIHHHHAGQTRRHLIAHDLLKRVDHGAHGETRSKGIKADG
mgnify:CR=1 FL=1|jgi:hypothetical protein